METWMGSEQAAVAAFCLSGRGLVLWCGIWLGSAMDPFVVSHLCVMSFQVRSRRHTLESPSLRLICSLGERERRIAIALADCWVGKLRCVVT